MENKKKVTSKISLLPMELINEILSNIDNKKFFLNFRLVCGNFKNGITYKLNLLKGNNEANFPNKENCFINKSNYFYKNNLVKFPNNFFSEEGKVELIIKTIKEKFIKKLNNYKTKRFCLKLPSKIIINIVSRNGTIDFGSFYHIDLESNINFFKEYLTSENLAEIELTNMYDSQIKLILNILTNKVEKIKLTDINLYYNMYSNFNKIKKLVMEDKNKNKIEIHKTSYFQKKQIKVIPKDTSFLRYLSS